MKIYEAAIEVMKEAGCAMSASEIHTAIVRRNLFQFNSMQSVGIVRKQLRRHCQGLMFSDDCRYKCFVLHANGKYSLLDQSGQAESEPSGLSTANTLRSAHGEYLESFKQEVLEKICTLPFADFERFGLQLLRAYGFEDTHNTPLSKDGGFDGYGRLEQGIGHLRCAFECKRWTAKKNIGVQEIDRFRGAIVGRYDLGVYFTTSGFTKSAIEAAARPEAPPAITLVDGIRIVDVMIEKKLAIETEEMPLYTYLPDMLFEDD